MYTRMSASLRMNATRTYAHAHHITVISVNNIDKMYMWRRIGMTVQTRLVCDLQALKACCMHMHATSYVYYVIELI